MPKGKIPSLIGSSLGKPMKAIAGKKCECSRCHADLMKGEECYDVPQPLKPHSATRRFCRGCFGNVLEQTKRDLAELEALME